jgi:hypothetical protein
MIGFMLRDGQSVVLPQVVIFGAFSLVGLALVVRFVSAIGESDSQTTTQPPTATGDVR